MALTLKAGSRLYSTVCTTELMVIKAPEGDVGLTIGGAEPALQAGDGPSGAVTDGHGGGAAMGKRYADADATVSEV